MLCIRCWQLVDSLILHLNKSQYEHKNPLFSHVGEIPANICIPLIISWISWSCRTAFSSTSTELKNIHICINTNHESDSKTSPWKICIILGIICAAPFVACAISFQTEILESEQYNILSTYFVSCLDNLTGNEEFLIQWVYYSSSCIFCVFMFLVQMQNVMFEVFGVLLVTSILVYVNWFQRSLKECDDIEEVKYCYPTLYL